MIKTRRLRRVYIFLPFISCFAFFCLFFLFALLCFGEHWIRRTNEWTNELTNTCIFKLREDISLSRSLFFFSSFIIFLNRALSDGKLNAVSSSCALPVTASHSTSENVFSTTVHHSTVDDYMIGCEFIQFFFCVRSACGFSVFVFVFIQLRFIDIEI